VSVQLPVPKAPLFENAARGNDAAPWPRRFRLL